MKDGEFVQPRHTARYILQYVENYDRAEKKILEITDKLRVTINVRWEAPLLDWISIYTYGVVRHGVVGCGGILRDHREF
jgi:hypothetical protein